MIKLLGIPFDANSSFLKGPSLAPQRIRQADTDGSANRYSESCIEIKEGVNYQDAGDIQFPNEDPESAFHLIRNRIVAELEGGNRICSLGGDHSVSYPIIDAFTQKYPGLHVLHLDAHTDLYENFDNNPYSHASPFARLLEKGKLGSLTQVGIRSLTQHQREQVVKYGVKITPMKSFSLNFLHSLSGPLYLSLDLDVLDPAYAPGVSHHEPGGLSTRELIRIIQDLPVTLVGADIVEYNPDRDINGTTAMIAYKLFKEIVSNMLHP